MSQLECERAVYRPDSIKILFVAEAPPPADSGRFFYLPQVENGDSLYLELMKVLHPKEALSVTHLRRNKRDLLTRFKNDGFYLIDACDKPFPRDTPYSVKVREIRAGLDALRMKIRNLCAPDTKVILISKPVYEVCNSSLAEFNVVNTEMIDFPGSGNQVKFRAKLGRLLADVRKES